MESIKHHYLLSCRLTVFVCVLFLFSVLSSPIKALTVEYQQFDSISQELEYYSFAHAGKALELVGRLQAIANVNLDDISLTIETLFWEGRTKYLQGVRDASLQSRCTALLEQLDKSTHPVEDALLYYILAMYYITDGNFAHAFSMALQSVEKFQTMEDFRFISKVYYLLGTIGEKTQNWKMAINYHQQALAFSSPSQRDYNSAFIALYTNMASSILDDEKNMPLDSLESLTKRLELFKDAGIRVSAYFNLGSLYYTYGDEERGFSYYEKCKTCIEDYEIDNNALTFALYLNLSWIRLFHKDFEQAVEYMSVAKRTAEKNNNIEQISHTLYLISNIHKELGNIDSAYFYLTEYDNLREKLLLNSKTIETYQAYISVYLESSQNKLIIAEQKIALKNHWFIIFGLSCFGIISVIIIIVIAVHQKKCRQIFIKDAENRELTKLLTQEKKIKQLQKEKIESQVRELSSHTLLISEKKSIFQQIDSHINHLPDTCKKVKEIEQIKQIVKSNLITDHGWENFVLHFCKVHPLFFERLKQYCPRLTEGNLRLCAYLRIGMQGKQIAQVLNISPEYVRASTYRLKKKLELKEGESLHDFLRSLSSDPMSNTE
jgi:hypothetical protein